VSAKMQDTVHFSAPPWIRRLPPKNRVGFFLKKNNFMCIHIVF